MTIRDYRKFLNQLPKEFDDYEITHREYTDISGDEINAKIIEVYSVHIDDENKVACNMHKAGYHLYQEFNNTKQLAVPNTDSPKH